VGVAVEKRERRGLPLRLLKPSPLKRERGGVAPLCAVAIEKRGGGCTPPCTVAVEKGERRGVAPPRIVAVEKRERRGCTPPQTITVEKGERRGSPNKEEERQQAYLLHPPSLPSTRGHHRFESK